MAGADVRFTPYGRREIVTATAAAMLACAALAGLAWAFSPYVLAGLAAPLAGWAAALAFFRDPHRQVPPGPGLFVSPADGRVAEIAAVGPDSPLGCEGTKVAVFMSVLDVHVNRSPVDGQVERIEHRPGRFLDARDGRASAENESATIRLRCQGPDGSFPVVVRQVAGLIARRIVTDLAEGRTVRRGQRIGMVKFGSRVELMVPRELARQVLVDVGRKVRAGQTVLISSQEAGHG